MNMKKLSALIALLLGLLPTTVMADDEDHHLTIVGNQVVSNSQMYRDGGHFPTSLNLPIHIEIFHDNPGYPVIAGADSFFSFRNSYTVPPVCQVTPDSDNAPGALVGYMRVRSVSTAGLTVHNGTNVLQYPYITCDGN
jgi:hypothetical protein